MGILSVVGIVGLSGCQTDSKKSEATSKNEKKAPPMTLAVRSIDQLSSLDDNVPDGQYLVARVSLKNDSNATIVLDPADFVLQNITKNEEERYSQPAERGLTNAFGRIYGSALRERLMDFSASNLYPRMEIERYFVFMVPSDAVVNGYQITYKPASISIPLVTSEATIINDHRIETNPINDSQSDTSSNP